MRFRQGLTTAELVKIFPGSKITERWFESKIWKEATPCDTDSTTVARHQKMTYYCYKCRFLCQGMVMQQSRIYCQNRAITTYVFETNPKNISSMKLHRDLGITQQSA